MTPHKLLRLRLRRLRRDEHGVAAVEFSLVAPVLFLVALATVDIGMAVTERMTISHVLRAGANFAMVDPGEAKVRDVLKATAQKNFTECPATQPGGGTEVQTGDCIKIDEPKKRFACPDDPGTAVADPSTCSGDYHTFYRLSVAKTYVAMILPDISFRPVIDVQIR